MPEVVGTLMTLSRFPVKSMQGETLPQAEVSEPGLVGDRAYALVDTAAGKVMSAKNPRVGAQLLACRAEFVESPSAGLDVPPVRITMPNGSSVASDEPNANTVLSEYVGREVTLQRAAPEDFTIDQQHPDVEDLDPEGHRDTVTETRLGAAFFAQAGLPSPVPGGSFMDLFPVSILTTSTLAYLQELRPDSRFDARRFRMNLVIETPEDGFVENGWIGSSLLVGDDARLAVFLPDPRCVMTTLPQGDLPKDTEVLRTLVRHNRIDVAGGLYPCAGVYAVVETGGAIRPGDGISRA